MEEERYSSRELAPAIPKNIGFLVERPSSGSTSKVPTDPSQRSLPPILDRFRACLRDREEEMGVSSGEGVPQEEIVKLYREALQELTFNSKPIITDLTIIAGEHPDCGKGIASAICSRILEVPVEQKLPSLYLLDSIVKNIRDDYVQYFAARLPDVFCKAYKQVDPSLYPAMRHLFRTWADVFPPTTLRAIEAKLQFSPRTSFPSAGLTSSRTSESQSPRPAHSIHVNPKYLLGRHQFENANVIHKTDPHNTARMTDFEVERIEREHSASPKGWSGASPKFHHIDHARSVASSIQVYRQKPSIGYGDYDFDHGEVLSPQIGLGRVGSIDVPVGSSSSLMIGEQLLSPSRIKHLRSSPSRIGPRRSLSPPMGELVRDFSPGRAVEMDSTSQTRFGVIRAANMMGERNDWWERRFPDDGTQRMEASRISVPNQSNGFEQRRLPQTRALIDAYGNYRGKPTLYREPLKVEQRIEVNGINSKEASRKWQTSEEEEYVWEDMSPTLSDRSRSNDVMASDSFVGSLSTKGGLGKSNAGFLDPDLVRGTLPGRALQSLADEPAVTVDDTNSALCAGHGSMSSNSFHGRDSQDEALYHSWGSYDAQEHSRLPHQFPQSSQQYLDLKSRPRALPSSNTEAPFQRFQSSQSNRGLLCPNPLNLATPASMGMMETHLAQRPQSPPAAAIPWPTMYKSYPLPSLPALPHQKPIAQFDSMDINKSLVNQDPNRPFVAPLQQLHAFEKKTLNSTRLLPHQHAGLISLNQPNREQPARLLPQLLQASEADENLVLPAPEQIPFHLLTNSLLGIPPPSMPINNIPHAFSSHRLGRAPPPLPPGPPPSSSQVRPTSQNTGPILPHPPSGNAFSGLISSLMAQGLISLTPSTSLQDPVGVEFNADLIKVRHESAIIALYADLPRQCTTCGLRFKCQEEHRSHMDWHVTKNRMSKNRKQKPSRKWFASAKEWLSGTEALGADVVPGFLPAEVVSDRKDDQEMAVPADENQNVCALCGEPFEDFYSDETDEWMYKGAVYLNSLEGPIEGMDKSLLGPIVHAKCRSESTTNSQADFEGDEVVLGFSAGLIFGILLSYFLGNNDDLGIQRKKIRLQG